jgi:hypothetical protein
VFASKIEEFSNSSISHAKGFERARLRFHTRVAHRFFPVKGMHFVLLGLGAAFPTHYILKPNN